MNDFSLLLPAMCKASDFVAPVMKKTVNFSPFSEALRAKCLLKISAGQPLNS